MQNYREVKKNISKTLPYDREYIISIETGKNGFKKIRQYTMKFNYSSTKYHDEIGDCGAVMMLIECLNCALSVHQTSAYHYLYRSSSFQ